MTAEAQLPIHCSNCGTPGTGNFCAHCGAELSAAKPPSYLLFVDAFLKAGEIGRYLATYLRILRSPTRTTIELFRTTTLPDALRFLEYSAGIVLLLVISRFITARGNDLLAGLLATLYFLLAQSISLLLHYRLVAGRARVRRTFDEFLRFASLFLGFTIPISAVLQALRIASPTAGAVLLIVLTIPLLVYSVRVWKYFWGLGVIAVFFYLFISSLLGGIAGLAFIFLVGLLFG